MEIEVPYLIEKAFKRYPGYTAVDTVYEYAICMHCAMEINSKLSTSSRANIEAYMASKASLETRAIAIQNAPDNNWTEECLIYGTSRNDCEDYVIYGMFYRDQMLKNGFPYMLGQKALDEIIDLLSPETREEFDRFMDDIYSGPPELLEILKDRPPVFV